MKYSVLLSMLLLAGCSTVPMYEHPSNMASARFSLSSTNDSEGAMLKRVDVFLFKNEQCETYDSGSNIGFVVENELAHEIPQHMIPANQGLMVSAVYYEARWGEGWSCPVLAGFTPEEGHSYEGILTISNGGKHCKLGVLDKTENKEVTDLVFPEYVCGTPTNKKVLNGQPTQYLISVSSY